MQHFPLRSSGRRILNYLADWLILVQSLDKFISHIDSLLIHLESLGLCVNRQRAFSPPPLARSHGDESPPLARSRGDESPPLARSSHGQFVFPAPFQARQLCSVEGFSETARTQGGRFSGMSSGIITHAPAAAMAEISSPVDGVDFGMFAHRGHIEALTQPRSLQPGSSPVLGSVTRDGQDRCIDSRLGSSVQGNASFGTVAGISEPVAHKPLELKAVFLALKDFQPQLERQHVLIRTDNTSVVSYINHQKGIRSRALCKQATDCLPLHQSCAHPRSPDPRGGHVFEEGDSSRRVEIAPRVGSDDLEPLALRESGGGSVRQEREHALPVVLNSPLTSRWPAARPYAFPPIKKCCHWCYERSGRSKHQ